MYNLTVIITLKNKDGLLGSLLSKKGIFLNKISKAHPN
jgi:hypothetical protein